MENAPTLGTLARKRDWLRAAPDETGRGLEPEGVKKLLGCSELARHSSMQVRGCMFKAAWPCQCLLCIVTDFSSQSAWVVQTKHPAQVKLDARHLLQHLGMYKGHLLLSSPCSNAAFLCQLNKARQCHAAISPGAPRS